MGLGRRGGRGLEAPQDVVAQRDRVGEVLEAECMIGEPGDGQRPGNRAERDDEVLVGHIDEHFLGLDLDALPVGSVGDCAPEHEVGVRAHQPQRHDDVAWLERPGRRFGEHRGEEHEVLGADDRCALLLEQLRDVAAGEAASEDERAATCLRIHAN